MKRILALSRKDPDELQALLDMPKALLNTIPDSDEEEVVGEFFSEGSIEDHKRQEDEDSGVAEWLDRIRKM